MVAAMTSRRGAAAVALALAAALAVPLVVMATSTAVAMVETSPTKTTITPIPGPGSTVAPTAPVTTLWPTTTGQVAPPSTIATSVGVTVPPSIAGTTAAPSTFAPPPTTTGAVPFDGATFLREFYGQLGLVPADAVDLVEQASLGSAADAFLYHEIGIAIALFIHSTAPLPAYTVTPQGAGVSVCRDDGICELFSDFVLDAGLLSSFSIDGQPILDRVGSYERATTVEALTIDGAFSLRRPNVEQLSIVVLLTSEGGGTTFAWEQATYVDATGRQYAIDLAASHTGARMEDGDSTVAHVVFAGAQHGGQLVIPITTDLTGVAATIRIPVTISQ